MYHEISFTMQKLNKVKLNQNTKTVEDFVSGRAKDVWTARVSSDAALPSMLSNFFAACDDQPPADPL